MKQLVFVSSIFLTIAIFSCKKSSKEEIPSPTLIHNSNTTSSSIVDSLIIPNDSIILNLYGYTPLCATIHFETQYSGTTEIKVRGKNGSDSDIERTFSDSTLSHAHSFTGLYPDFDNTVEVNFKSNDGKYIAKKTLSIKTEALPPNMPTSITVAVANRTSMEKGLNLVSSFSADLPKIPYLVDSYGDIRWLLDYTSHPELKNLSYDDGIARLKNGNYFFGDQSTGKIYEVDFLGKVINSWSFPNYVFHHEVHEKPNGNFLLSVNKNGSTNSNGTATVEDYIIEIDRNNGSIIKEWDLKEPINPYRTVLSTNSNDWMHVNAVIYDPSDNTIIVSGRVQGIVKLDYDNQVKWILGAHKGWDKNGRGEDLEQFLLQPLDANGNAISDTAVINGTANHPDFEWNWYQHSTIINPNGNLMFFDNGDVRNFDPLADEKYSRAVEYKIDMANKTVQQLWSYGKERGLETFSRIVSSVKFLPEKNHVLFSPGYNVANSNGNGGKVVEIDYTTKQVVFEMSISSQNNWGFHRVIRMPIYP